MFSFSISFCAIVGTLLTKTNRIHRIFSKKAMRNGKNRHYPLRDNVFPFQTTCHSLENMILCLRYIHIHVSSYVQPLDKEMIL